jgi:hypothetical protein
VVSVAIPPAMMKFCAIQTPARVRAAFAGVARGYPQRYPQNL